MFPASFNELLGKFLIIDYLVLVCTLNAILVLANKWRILHRLLDVDIEYAIAIVKACCVLHNFVRKKDGYQFEDAIITPKLLLLPV